MEREKKKEVKDNGNNKRGRRRNQAGKLRAQEIDRRRRRQNGQYLRPIL